MADVASTGAPGGSPGGDPGLRARMDACVEGFASVVGPLDPDRLSGADARELYASVARMERLALGAKAVLARRIDDSGVWRDGGHRDAASLLGSLEGVPAGQARPVLELGHQLAVLPGTEEAVRSGRLSRSKATELAGAASGDPSSEDRLLAGAEDEPFPTFRDRCRRAKAAQATADPMAATRRAHANRSLTWWNDPDGTFHYRGSDTAERGAKLVGRLGPLSDAIRAEAKRVGSPQAHEAGRALAADALFALMTSAGPVAGDVDLPPDDGLTAAGDPGVDRSSGGHSGTRRADSADSANATDAADATDDIDIDSIVRRPPTCAVTVVVDLATLVRGTIDEDGVCEIEGVGPVPPQLVRSMMTDSFLRFLATGDGDIRCVSHFGRTINARLRTALAYRDRMRCVVPGCGVRHRLEIDHVRPVEALGLTELDNLALLCHFHHHLKTNEGWVLERVEGPDRDHPTWTFAPQPAFGREPDLGFDTEEARAARRQARAAGARGMDGPLVVDSAPDEPRPAARDEDHVRLFDLE